MHYGLRSVNVASQRDALELEPANLRLLGGEEAQAELLFCVFQEPDELIEGGREHLVVVLVSVGHHAH